MDFLEIIDIWGRFHPMLHFELTSQGRITVNVAPTCAFNSIVGICWDGCVIYNENLVASCQS